MSLNRAAVALGAVVVLGAGTLGLGYGWANAAGKPEPRIYVTAGSTWVPVKPTCYNDGKKLSATQLKACSVKVQAVGSTDKATPVTATRNTSFTISVDRDVTDQGWLAEVGNSALVPLTTDYQANNLPVNTVLATTTDPQTGASTTADKGTVLVLERKGNDIFGAWLVTVRAPSAS